MRGIKLSNVLCRLVLWLGLSLLGFGLLPGAEITLAQAGPDWVGLTLDGPEEVILQDASMGVGQLLAVDIPVSYQGSHIEFSARSGGDSYQDVILSYRNASGELDGPMNSCSSHGSIEVPVTPGETTYMNVGVCEKHGYSYASVHVRTTSMTMPDAPAPQDVGVQISDDFAEVVGTLPDLFFDNDDSTYVRGGIIPGDYDAVFTMPVQEVDPLKFWTRVQCIEGSCGGKEVCGYRLFIKNQETGEFDRLGGAQWEEAGFHEYEVATDDPDPRKYVRNGVAEFWFSFHCNMDGYVNEFQQIVDGNRTAPQAPTPTMMPTETSAPTATPPPTDTPTATPTEPKIETVSFLVIYLNNQDDDALYVNVSLDGGNVGALEVEPGGDRIFGKTEVTPGHHTLTARWDDPDTGERYETEAASDFGTGEEKAITLNLAGHQAPTPTMTPTETSMPTATPPPPPTLTPTPSTSTAVVNIKNKDDDTLDIVLYVDDDYAGHWIVSDWTNQVEEVEVSPGPHRFVIEWMDPDTGEDYESVVSADFAPGEMRKVNVEVERHEPVPTDTPLPPEATKEPVIVPIVEDTPAPVPEEEHGEAVRELTEEETIQRLQEASGYADEFSEMYTTVEEEIVDSFSDPAIYADLLVYSASPAGYAVEGQEIKATLFIQNKSDDPVAVAAAIVLPSQDWFKYSEKAYFSSISNISAWDWNVESAMQFYFGGGAFILEPDEVLTFDSRVIPKQDGYFDVTGEIFYDWNAERVKDRIKAYTSAKKAILPFALGITVVEYELDEMDHVTLAKSIFVEEKKCSWGGLICR